MSQNILSLPQFVKKALFTLTILMFARLGIFIPVPGIDHYAFQNSVSQNSFINFLNIFSGGGFSTIGIFALGIVPYINASLIMQLLIKAIPYLENLQKEEGDSGRQKLNQLTRYLTLGWGIIQSVITTIWIKPYVFNWNLNFVISTIFTLTCGSIIILWFSELITNRGFGNGASLLIFQNIISSAPKALETIKFDITNVTNLIRICSTLAIFLLMLAITIIVQEGVRNIKVVSARQLNKQTSKDIENYLPLRINQGGVMPLVFASAAINIPSYFLGSLGQTQIHNFISLLFSNSLFYLLLYFALIILFSQFYSSLIMSPDDIASNLKKMGISIYEIRPGRTTSSYLNKTLRRLTIIGSVSLLFIALMPSIIEKFLRFQLFKNFGATSLIILVGVSIDTGKQIQAYLISSKYKSMSK